MEVYRNPSEITLPEHESPIHQPQNKQNQTNDLPEHPLSSDRKSLNHEKESQLDEGHLLYQQIEQQPLQHQENLQNTQEQKKQIEQEDNQVSQMTSQKQETNTMVEEKDNLTNQENQFDELCGRLISYSNELEVILEEAKKNTSWMCVHNKLTEEIIHQSFSHFEHEKRVKLQQQQEHQLTTIPTQEIRLQSITNTISDSLGVVCQRLDSILATDHAFADLSSRIDDFSTNAFNGQTPELIALQTSITAQEEQHLIKNLKQQNDQLASQVATLLAQLQRQAEIKEAEISVLKESHALSTADLRAQLTFTTAELKRAKKSAKESRRSSESQLAQLRAEVHSRSVEVSTMLKNSQEREKCLEQETNALRASLSAIETSISSNPSFFNNSTQTTHLNHSTTSTPYASVNSIKTTTTATQPEWVQTLKQQFVVLQLTPFNMKIDSLIDFLQFMHEFIAGTFTQSTSDFIECIQPQLQSINEFQSQVFSHFALIENKINNITSQIERPNNSNSKNLSDAFSSSVSTHEDSLERIFKDINSSISESGGQLTNEIFKFFENRISKISSSCSNNNNNNNNNNNKITNQLMIA